MSVILLFLFPIIFSIFNKVNHHLLNICVVRAKKRLYVINFFLTTKVLQNLQMDYSRCWFGMEVFTVKVLEMTGYLLLLCWGE